MFSDFNLEIVILIQIQNQITNQITKNSQLKDDFF